MSFELTINRVGSFAGNLPDVVITRDLELGAIFRAQLDFVIASSEFASSIAMIRKSAPQYCAVEPDEIDDEEELHLRIRQITVPGAERDGTLVGILPSRKFRFAAFHDSSGRSVDWIVQARASITSCALQPGDRDAKVWWTFEGVPANEDALVRPSGEDIAAFVAATDKMADSALDLLHQAYRRAVKETFIPTLGSADLRKRPVRLRIRMSDSNDQEVRSLLNAVYYERLDVTEIRNAANLSSARKGLEILERFVSSVTHTSIDIKDNSLRVEAGSDGLKGILYQPVTNKNERIVAGLGQKAGSILGLEGVLVSRNLRGRKAEGYLRAMSASRPVSAIVADSEAAFPSLMI